MVAEDIIMDFYKTLLGGQFANLIVAVIILLLGLIIGKIARRVVKKLLHEIDLDKNVKKAGLKFSIENFISSFTLYLIYFVAVVEALNQFGIVTPVFIIIIGGVIIFVVVVTLLAVKDFIPNLFAGLYIFRTDFIKKGDEIHVHNLTGVVKEITLTKTKIKTKSNDLVFIPNSVITKSEIKIKK